MDRINSGARWVVGLLVSAMIGFYVVCICYLNVSLTPSFYITDMYSDVMVAQQMWQGKTAFPEGWVFGNQLYVMATPNLAALFCAITDNPFLAMAAASSVMAILVLWSFDWMLKSAYPQIHDRLVAIAAFLGTVVLFGDAVKMMNGWQLLFTMCSYYACYAITAFLAFGCYLRCDSKLSVLSVVFTCILSFSMGIQSLRQTAVMAAPLVGMEFFRIIGCALRKESIRCKSLSVALAVVCSNAAGVLAGKFIPVKQVSIFGKVGMRGFDRIPAALSQSVEHITGLFARDTSYPNETYRLVLLVCVILAVTVYLATQKKALPKTKVLMYLFVLSIAAVWGIDVFLTLNIRSIYYFMLYPFLACLLGYVYGQKSWLCKLPAVILLCVVFAASCKQEVLPAVQTARDRYWQQTYEISEDLQDKGYTVVYSTWNRCEDIAVASGGNIRSGFWHSQTDPFTPVTHLCNPEIYEADADQVVYLFYGEDEANIGIDKAKDQGLDMQFVAHYPDRDIYLYTAPVNLLEYFYE